MRSKARDLITPFLSLLLINILIVAFTPEFRSMAQVYSEISVIPQTSFVLPEQDFNVSITVSNVNNLYTYQVYINFSSEILEVKDIFQGDFLSRGTFTTFWQPKWNNTEGLIQVWESMLRPDPPSFGSGELFKVAFKAKKGGSSLLHLFETKLIDNFKAPIRHETKDGIVTTAKIELIPKEMKGQGYGPGDTLSINVTLSGVIENLYGLNLTIKYDSKIINATSVELSQLLAMPNKNFTNIDNAKGMVNLNVTCESGAPPTHTTGLIATITFDIVGFGESFIEIVDSKLIDINGKEIIHLLEKAFLYNILRNVAIIPNETFISPESLTAGKNITLNLKVLNNGVMDETFTVLVYAISEFTAIIGGPNEYTIAKESNKTLEITLSTNGLEGDYTLIITLSYVPGEFNLTDNEYQYPFLISVYPKEEAFTFPFEWIAYIIVMLIIAIIVIAVYKKRVRLNKQPERMVARGKVYEKDGLR